MDEFVVIPIPDDIGKQDVESLRRYFQDQILNTGDGFSEALDLACDQRNSIAVLQNVTINRVSIAADSIEIGYQVELTEFQACQDLTSDYSFARSITGKKLGDGWRFRKYVPVPQRSTCDEL